MTMPPTTRRELLAPVKRWTPVHKFWICHGIHHQVITMQEAMHVHGISNEEIVCWYSTYENEGAHGFKRQGIGSGRYAA